MITEQVKSLCSQLRFVGLQSALERRASEAVANQLHPVEFLRILFEDEILARRDRTAKALVSKASFRFMADLEDWDSSFERGLSKPKIKELSHLSFYYNKENLLLVGGTGTGKTHLAVSIGRRACAENHSTAFIPVNFLFEEALAQKASGKYIPYIKKLSKIQIIILDDLGLRNYTHEEANVLIDILEERYHKGSTIITSQVNPEGWVKLFADPVIGEAIVDRIRNPSQTIKLTGTTYRGKIGAKKKSGEKHD